MRRGLEYTRLDVRRPLNWMLGAPSQDRFVVQALRRRALAGPGTADVKKVEDYRQHADECRSMANRSRSPTERAMLLNMANTWDSLAVDREAHIERRKRLANLENGAQQGTRSIPIDRLNAANDE
jgi:hypothetical protein